MTTKKYSIQKLLVLAIGLLLSSIYSWSNAAQEDEITAIRNYLEKRSPPISPRSISPTPILGIYEVYSDGSIFYMDKTASFALVGGSLLNDISKKNLTEDRLQELGKIKFADLPLQNAIKIIKGTGAYKFAIFTDPDCPYCKSLEQGLANHEINDYTAYIFLYPLKKLHPEATAKSEFIWCAKDKAEAWTSWMIKGINPVKATCENPISQNVKLAEDIGVNGTPSIYLENGQQSKGLQDLINKIKANNK